MNAWHCIAVFSFILPPLTTIGCKKRSFNTGGQVTSAQQLQQRQTIFQGYCLVLTPSHLANIETASKLTAQPSSLNRALEPLAENVAVRLGPGWQVEWRGAKGENFVTVRSPNPREITQGQAWSVARRLQKLSDVKRAVPLFEECQAPNLAQTENSTLDNLLSLFPEETPENLKKALGDLLGAQDEASELSLIATFGDELAFLFRNSKALRVTFSEGFKEDQAYGSQSLESASRKASRLAPTLDLLKEQMLSKELKGRLP